MIPLGVFSTEALDVPDVEAGVSAKKVCIIDTGYSYDHEDLPKRGVSGSASGEADWAVDGNGHGTHVAGIIAALEGNGKGVVGVTRSGNLNFYIFYIVKVFDDFGGWIWSSGLMDAVEKCADAGANVINLSFGRIGQQTKFESDTFDDLLYKRNVLVVTASGNTGKNDTFFLASYDAVVSVGAVDSKTKQIGDFSTYQG